jgi:formate hydrogenlyase subunit 6/NADH:ubiquinone oxidoreductase subunit I
MARIIFRNLLAGPATRRFPYVVRPSFAASRGRITIDYPRCIHCGACARRCPANAIVVGKAPKSWRIENFACVTCGLCVRVCPVKCLDMDIDRPKAVLFADLAGRIEEHITPPATPLPAEGGPGGAAPGAEGA